MWRWEDVDLQMWKMWKWEDVDLQMYYDGHSFTKNPSQGCGEKEQSAWEDAIADPWIGRYRPSFKSPQPLQPTPSKSTFQWRWTIQDQVEHLHDTITEWTTSSYSTTINQSINQSINGSINRINVWDANGKSKNVQIIVGPEPPCNRTHTISRDPCQLQICSIKGPSSYRGHLSNGSGKVMQIEDWSVILKRCILIWQDFMTATWLKPSTQDRVAGRTVSKDAGGTREDSHQTSAGEDHGDHK